MYINAVGIEYPEIHDISKELLIEILGGKRIYKDYQLDITECQNSREYRRFDRLSIISMEGIKKVKQEIDERHISHEYDMATIFITSFGPIKTNIDFIASIYAQDGTVPSPITFSHTVNNAALGHVCKNEKYKGPSTLLLSSNGIGTASLILEEKSAKTALVIGAEQYCEELQLSYQKRAVNVVEAVAVLIMSLEKDDNTYSMLVGHSEGNLGGHPFYGKQIKRLDFIEKLIDCALQRSRLTEKDIQYVVINSFDAEITEKQLNYYKNLNSDITVINLYDSMGEMLGADLCAEISIVSKLYQEKLVEKEKYCVVHSLDISGNYITYILGGVQ